MHYIGIQWHYISMILHCITEALVIVVFVWHCTCLKCWTGGSSWKICILTFTMSSEVQITALCARQKRIALFCITLHGNKLHCTVWQALCRHRGRGQAGKGYESGSVVTLGQSGNRVFVSDNQRHHHRQHHHPCYHPCCPCPQWHPGHCHQMNCQKALHACALFI